MKINRLEIIDYHQFDQLVLDLTYPKGHEKAGQALDKVCLIGQSGTGKTSLLKICLSLLEKNYIGPEMKQIVATMELEPGAELTLKIRDGKLSQSTKDSTSGKSDEEIKTRYREHRQRYTGFIYFPAEMTRLLPPQESSKRINPLDALKVESTVNNTTPVKTARRPYFDFEQDNILEVWDDVLKNIYAYKVKEVQYSLKFRQELTVAIATGMEQPEIKKIIESDKAWKLENPNPLEKLAQQLNPLLHKFGLNVKTTVEFESIEDLKFIQIESLRGSEIPYGGWSTGSKQVVLMLTPLFQLDTDHAIILIDEPERSLYPDIQTEIINYCTELAPQAQFFFATHSPILTSAFEPWEIVELKFDDQGAVYQELYYTGERHIDNYFLDPRYLRWDTILLRIFDLAVEGNEQYRNKALMRASRLQAQLEKLKQENRLNTEEGKKLLVEFEKWAQKLAWRLHEKDR
jgi:ABC-type cobalamin/Fe3+-siderophores transport system ATPase subunit